MPIGKRRLLAFADILNLDALTAEMATRCHLPTTTPLTVIVAEHDQIVPVEGAVLNGTELRHRYREQKLVQTDHFGLPFSMDITAHVAMGVLKTTKRMMN
jgi:hypothetical protein